MIQMSIQIKGDTKDSRRFITYKINVPTEGFMTAFLQYLLDCPLIVTPAFSLYSDHLQATVESALLYRLLEFLYYTL